MSIQEKLGEIERKGEGFSDRLEAKRQLRIFREQISQTGRESIEAIAGCLEASSLLDILEEVIDCIPQPVFLILSSSPEEIARQTSTLTFDLRWNLKGLEYINDKRDPFHDSLIVAIPFKAEKIEIYSVHFVTPLKDLDNTYFSSFAHLFFDPYSKYAKKRYFEKLLIREQWQDREFMEATIADALWAAGVRPRSTEANTKI